MSAHPEVLWAQRSSPSDPAKAGLPSIWSRSNVVFLTVNLPDIEEPSVKLDLQSNKISLQAKAGHGGETKNYAFDLDFYAEIDAEATTKRLTSRSLYLVIRKKELKEEYWPRLTKEKLRTPFIKTDFSKWVDEDEQDGDAAVLDDDVEGMGGMGGMPGMGGMGGMPGMGDMGGMGGMPGMGGMGGMDFEKMMASMGGGLPSEGASDGPAGDDSDDDDDDGPPPLEEAEPAKP